jgi:hypothetical protein
MCIPQNQDRCCAWQAALEALKRGNPGGDSEGALEGVLIHSLAGLAPPRVSMFLDVATILRGQRIDTVRAVWAAWHGPAAPNYYDDLVRRCLVETDSRGRLVVHDVLTVLGRGIILHKHPKFKEHFGSRLWTEGYNVVGSEQVEIIFSLM